MTSPTIDATSELKCIPLDEFEMLYQDEITVLHDWDILRRNAERIQCEIGLVDIASTGEWLAPWYVGQGADGTAGPVNILGGALTERAQYDKLHVEDSTPRWPNALPHGELPQGMRSKAIDNMRQVLEARPSATISVIVYELIVDNRTGRTLRLVLDGNHRLAAARIMSRIHPVRRLMVQTFLIRELAPVDDLIVMEGTRERPYQWRGFTPDVGLIRGTWPPTNPRLQAVTTTEARSEQ